MMIASLRLMCSIADDSTLNMPGICGQRPRSASHRRLRGVTSPRKFLGGRHLAVTKPFIFKGRPPLIPDEGRGAIETTLTVAVTRC
jgi:hypothetical protein